jgi:hypothetical protein
MSAFYSPGLILGVALLASPAPADEVLPLFNGKDLTGWVMEPAQYKDKATGKSLPMWEVKDGLLVTPGKAFGFLRYDRQQFGDFKLHVEYRMAKNGNSGLGIRTGPFDPKRSRETRPSYFSYEVQLLDDAGKKPDKHSSGSLYRYVAPRANPIKPSPEWNTVEVECVGPRIRVTINGEQVLDVDQTTIPEIKDKPLKGYVCLQSHSHQVEFRKVRIQEK